jgi:hypothetical protein
MASFASNTAALTTAALSGTAKNPADLVIATVPDREKLVPFSGKEFPDRLTYGPYARFEQIGADKDLRH